MVLNDAGSIVEKWLGELEKNSPMLRPHHPQRKRIKLHPGIHHEKPLKWDNYSGDKMVI